MNNEYKTLKLSGMPFLAGSVGQDNYIWISEFNETATAMFLSQFKEMELNPAVQIIPVYIHSYGGDAHSLLAIRDIIKSSHKPVATIAVGMAMSCGVLLLAAGTKGLRFAGPNTQLMIHEAASIVTGKAADISENAKSFERLNEIVYVNFSVDTGISLKKIQTKMKDMRNADWYFEPEEALKWGIIDQIGIPRVTDSMSSSVLVKPNPYSISKKAKRTVSKKKR